jgi:hypothetical protein
MTIKKTRNQLLFITLILICISKSYSENKDFENDKIREFAPKVFIDCRRCDRDFIRTEITFINYVRDKFEADIYVLITDEPTGAGGRKYTLTFMGYNEFSGIEHTLTYVSYKTDTWDETRKGLVETLKRGLFPFLLKTPLSKYFSIDFQEKLQPTAVEDKWDFWVFSLSIGGNINGEKYRSSRSIDMNFSANRVTPELKIRMGISGNFDEKKFNYEDKTIISTYKNIDFSSLIVKSIGEHWSIGAWFGIYSSTYSNLKTLYTLAPAVEYNFYPYSISTRRQLRLLYRIGFNSVNYFEETIYYKTSEKLYNESLSIIMEVKEPWGSVSASLQGSHYFHDFEKNRLTFWSHFSFRIFKGLSIYLRGRYQRIRDQLYLPKGEATLEEVLLRRRELQTGYEYSLSIGVSYTFGSVFSNVVNPRFGGRGWR